MLVTTGIESESVLIPNVAIDFVSHLSWQAPTHHFREMLQLFGLELPAVSLV
jgi:hypothetical protein